MWGIAASFGAWPTPNGHACPSKLHYASPAAEPDQATTPAAASASNTPRLVTRRIPIVARPLFPANSHLEIRKRGGDHQRAAEELPDKVDHDLLKKFGVDSSDLAKSVEGWLGL
jgi:hypothetical protein